MDIVIYHGDGCYDGFTAAWLARKKYPAAAYHPAVHGDAPPDVRGKNVLMVDFCYEREVTKSIIEAAKSTLILDHHQTAKDSLEGVTCAYFDMDRSGAGLMWDYLFPGQERPDLVRFVEDADLRLYKYPETQTFCAALSALEMTFECWDTLEETDLRDILAKGALICESYEKTAQKLAERGGPLCMPTGHRVWCSNASPELLVYVAQYVMATKGLPSLSWTWDSSRGDCYCSIRTEKQNAAQIAQKYGGGGHDDAAGFRLAEPPPLLWKNKWVTVEH